MNGPRSRPGTSVLGAELLRDRYLARLGLNRQAGQGQGSPVHEGALLQWCRCT